MFMTRHIGLGDVAHPLGVTSGVPIPRVHRVRERPDRLLEHLARLHVPVVREPRSEQRNDEEGVAHQPMPFGSEKICAINQPNGASPMRFGATAEVLAARRSRWRGSI